MMDVKRVASSGLSRLSFAALIASSPAHAETTLYLAMNGGTMERLYADKVLPAFEQANQAPALEFGDQMPSNPLTPTSEKTRGQVEAMNHYLDQAVTLDWDQINRQRPIWNARWNRTIER